MSHLIVPVLLFEQLCNKTNILKGFDDLRRVVQLLDTLIYYRSGYSFSNISAHTMLMVIQWNFSVQCGGA